MYKGSYLLESLLASVLQQQQQWEPVLRVHAVIHSSSQAGCLLPQVRWGTRQG